MVWVMVWKKIKQSFTFKTMFFLKKNDDEIKCWGKIKQNVHVYHGFLRQITVSPTGPITHVPSQFFDWLPKFKYILNQWLWIYRGGNWCLKFSATPWVEIPQFGAFNVKKIKILESAVFLNIMLIKGKGIKFLSLPRRICRSLRWFLWISNKCIQI